MIKLIKDSFTHFLDSDPFQEGAALAYYSIFSLVPVIIIIISILDLFFSKQMVSGEVFGLFKNFLGEDAATQIQNTIKDQNTNHNSVLTTIIGFVTLAFAASGILSQIHDSFNRIWNLNAKVKNNIFSYASKHMMSLFLLITFLFFIFLTTGLNSFLVKHYDSIHIDYNYLVIVEHVISFVVASVIFTIMFKTLGDAKLNLKPAMFGGLITSFLFFVGKVSIGLYLGYTNPTSIFGSSSYIGIFMLWGLLYFANYFYWRIFC